jgi:hypothetical protein
MNVIWAIIVIVSSVESFNHELISMELSILGCALGLMIAFYPKILNNNNQRKD